MTSTGCQQGEVRDATGRTLFARAIRPLGFVARLRGLIGHRPLTESEAWWFSNCSAVHTFWMSQVIDVLHLADDGRIIRIRAGLTPGRMSRAGGGQHVVELMAGAARRLQLRNGLQLSFHP